MKISFIFFLMIILVGCANKGKDRQSIISDNSQVVVMGVASDSLNDIGRMERCQRELDALKKINNSVYIKRKKEFDGLMSGAGIYSGVRSDVSIYTQQAVDSYYRYHADKLCADISVDVLNNLATSR
ncbi:hypothetical protein EOG74_05030 [Salmonella enterica]|nr:hypothetical protein [Salmonella enterica]